MVLSTSKGLCSNPFAYASLFFSSQLIQKVAGLLQSSLSITVTQTDSTTSSAKVVVQLFHDSENQKLKDVYWSPQKRRHFYTLVAYDEGEENLPINIV